MKTRKSFKNNPKDEISFSSGSDLSKKEFMEGIKLAEKGSFNTVQESMKQFDKWVEDRKEIKVSIRHAQI